MRCQMKQRLLNLFPEAFSETLDVEKKINGSPVQLSYVDNMDEMIKKLRPAATVRKVPLQFEE